MLLNRDGEFPALKLAGALAPIDAGRFSQADIYRRFADAVDSAAVETSPAWMRTLGVEVGPDRALFLTQSGDWKLGKSGRARWIDFLADTLVDPAEVRLADAAPNAPEELLLLGGYTHGGKPLHTLLVFSRVGQQWQGRSAYQIDSTGDLARYRRQSMLAWLRK